MEQIDKNEDCECSICQENIEMKKHDVTLSCKHVFHQKCIFTWWYNLIPKNANCPVCRHQYPELDSDSSDGPVGIEGDGLFLMIDNQYMNIRIFPEFHIESRTQEEPNNNLNQRNCRVRCCGKNYKNVMTIMRHIYFYHNYCTKISKGKFRCITCENSYSIFSHKPMLDHLINVHGKNIQYVN